jgi:hypothetical protein
MGALRELTVKGSKEPNIICAVAGESQQGILVGTHFDSAGGDGVIDNRTGAVLLPSLSEFDTHRLVSALLIFLDQTLP